MNYNMYSWESRFGIVYSKCVRRQSDLEYRSMQQLCCERSVSIASYMLLQCSAKV